MTRGARGQGVGRLIFEVGALYLGSSGTRASVNKRSTTNKIDG